MSELTWKVVKPLSDQSSIQKLEKIIAATLPADYVECVIKNNAGYPSPDVFETLSGKQHVFNNLLTFDEMKRVNVFNTYQSLLDATGNKALLPIGEDPFGNYICFDLSEPNEKVVFWDHEINEVDAISTTFTEFLDKLHF